MSAALTLAPKRRAWLPAAMAVVAQWIGGCHRAVRPDVPASHGTVVEEGIASYYGAELKGRRTASGTRFDPLGFTAAHRTLPFGTCLVVQNLGNGKHVRVHVNDRGPYRSHRILDLSYAAARELGMVGAGTAHVRIYRCDSS